MERTAGQRDSELVRQTAELLSNGGSLSDLFERFCLLLAQFVDASVVFLALASERGVHIEFAYDHGLSARDAHVPIHPHSQTARVMQTGESMLMRGPTDLPQTQIPLQIPGASEEDAASAIFVPLRFGLRPIGVLSVQSPQPCAYDEHDRQLLETCAVYVAVRVQAEFMRPAQERAHAAEVDPVTGIATRRMFEERLSAEWQRARRTGGSIGIILLDIDCFKGFNDTYGYIAGDACLAQVAQAARACVSRSGDLFARYGGEAFAAIFHEVTPGAALSIAERMRTAVSALQIPHAQNREGILTASFGVATGPALTEDPRLLLRRADRALYAAKCAGRNRAVVDEPQDIDEAPQLGGNLPAFSTQTIGRALELDALARCLAISRLTTVVGPAGVGKTHCALAVAHQLVRAYVHGAWFFDLSRVHDASDVDEAVMSELLHQQSAHRHPRDAVLQYFAGKHCLLVLDNCGHIAQGARELCEALLARAPRATILATSRESLSVRDERVFHLTPLRAKDGEALFCAHAESVSPAIVFDEQEREQIRTICRQVNDLPHAIELLAQRVETLSPPQVVQGLPQRDITLEATFAWSYALLDERAQRLFERLSVFGHSFDADAARAICGFAPLRPGEAAAALDEIAGRHLIATVYVNEEQRFMLLGAARAYASQRLREGGEERTVQARHAEYYLALAQRLREPLHRESTELGVALERAFSSGDRDMAYSLVLALSEWWPADGRTREARKWIALALRGTREDNPRRAELLYAAARAAQSDGDFTALHEYASELLALEQASGDRVRIARACVALGDAEQRLDNAKAAEQWYTSALAHYRAAGDRPGAAAVLMNLGTAAGDLRLDFDAARSQFLDALHAFRELGLTGNAATALAKLGEVCAHSGDYESAVSYAAESLSLFERLRSTPQQAWQLANIARYRVERREWDRAASALRDAHLLLQEHPHREYAASVLEAGFYLACDLERHELAARIAGHLHAYREREAVPRVPSAQRHYDRRLRRARAKLGSSAFEAAFSSGPSHPIDTFVAEIVRK